MREDAAEKLIRAHDGSMALLYIHIMHTGFLDREKAAADLSMTISEISAAEEKLRRIGLLESSGDPVSVSSVPQPSGQASSGQKLAENDGASPSPAAQPLTPAKVKYPEGDHPQYTLQDVQRISESDPAFSAVLQEARSVFGQDLSSNDLRRLCSMYHELGLPAEVYFVLFHYCLELSAGNSRKLTLGFVEKRAYTWANQGIDSAELAEEYCDRQRAAKSEINRIKKALGITDRPLTDTEEKYISAWIGLGFDESSIYEAYDRTIMKTGKRSFAYMNGILENWDKSGIHSLEEIRSAETPPPAGRKKPGQDGPQETGSDHVDISYIEQIINNITGSK